MTSARGGALQIPLSPPPRSYRANAGRNRNSASWKTQRRAPSPLSENCLPTHVGARPLQLAPTRKSGTHCKNSGGTVGGHGSSSEPIRTHSSKAFCTDYSTDLLPNNPRNKTTLETFPGLGKRSGRGSDNPSTPSSHIASQRSDRTGKPHHPSSTTTSMGAIIRASVDSSENLHHHTMDITLPFRGHPPHDFSTQLRTPSGTPRQHVGHTGGPTMVQIRSVRENAQSQSIRHTENMDSIGHKDPERLQPHPEPFLPPDSTHLEMPGPISDFTFTSPRRDDISCRDSQHTGRGSTGTYPTHQDGIKPFHSPLPRRSGYTDAHSDTSQFSSPPIDIMINKLDTWWDIVEEGSLVPDQTNTEPDLTRMLPLSSDEPALRLQGQRRRPKGRCTAPLDQVTGPGLNITHIQQTLTEQWVSTDLKARLTYWLDAMIVKGTWETFFKEAMTLRSPNSKVTSRHFGQDDRQVLESITEPFADTHRQTCWIHPAFKVKKKNEFSRFILNCRQMNEDIHACLRHHQQVPPSMALPDIRAVFSQLGNYPFCSTTDATSFFFQLPLSRKLRRFFAFRFTTRRGKFETLLLKSLAMGFFASPAIAQDIAELVIQSLRHRVTDLDFFATVWVDNFIVAAHSPQDLARIKTTLADILKDFSIVHKEFDDSGLILGLQHTTSQGVPQIIIPQTYLETISELIREAHTNTTILHGLRTIGKLLFPHYALQQGDLCIFPASLSWLSTAATSALDQPCIFSADLLQEWSRWLLDLSNIRKRISPALVTPPARKTTWCDASTRSIASVIENRDLDINTIRSSTTACLPGKVFILEALAIYLTRMLTMYTHITILSDSKICVQAFTRGHSTHALLNAIIRECKSLPGTMHVTWCCTSCQRADPLTRGKLLPWPREKEGEGRTLSTTSCSIRYQKNLGLRYSV
jgi:hypothetical protein